jgi:hypothetical protein
VVVDFLGKENSKFDIVIHGYIGHIMGYGLLLEVSPQVEVDLQQEHEN